MEFTNAREALVHGVSLVRRGQAAEAIRYLEIAATEPKLKYASATLIAARAIASGRDVVEVAFRGKVFRFILQPENLGLGIHHAGGKFWEEPELAYCLKTVPSRANIVDIGANTGNHLLFFLGFLGPSLVIPVEPEPRAVAVLKRNLGLNQLSVDGRGLGLAAGRENGLLSLQSGEHEDLVVASTRDRVAGEAGPTVRSVALDELVPEKVDFLKIDVEGFEQHVLLGAERILSKDKPLLMIELQDGRRGELLKHLAQFGYQPFAEFAGVGYKNAFCRVR